MNYKCTHGKATKLFKIGKATLWGGSRGDLLDRPGWALVLSAIEVEGFRKSPLNAPEDVRALFPAATTLFDWKAPPCLRINWPDQGVPRLDRAWWRELAKTLPGVSGDVGVCCFGGHGRTGTALAILAALSGKVKMGDCPVAWVRKRYCEATVESEAQLDYIEAVTGRKVFSEATGFSFTGGTAYAGSGQSLVPKVQVGAANPPKATLVTLPTTKAGSIVGEVRAPTAEPTDGELINLWFQCSEDYVGLNGRRYTPVWDDKDEQEIIGWTVS